MNEEMQRKKWQQQQLYIVMISFGLVCLFILKIEPPLIMAERIS